VTTPVGLRISVGLTYEQWAEAGPKICRLVNTFAWCLGDWLVYGQDKFAHRYAEALAKVGLDYQTLRNYAWVARKVAPCRRRSTLSFQHHAEVAARSPAEQDAWLDRAARHRWTRTQLRRQLRQAQLTESATTDTAAFPRLEIESARLENWRLAAEVASVDLASWVVRALDEAAARILDPTAADATG
jgi:hypothetical protein